MKKFDGIIFDLDGTVVDTLPYTFKAMRKTVEKFTGRTLTDDEVVKELFGPPDLVSIEDSVPNEYTAIARQYYISQYDDMDVSMIEIPHMSELLAYLHESGIKVGMFTGRSEAVARKILGKVDYLRFFDLIIGGDSVTHPKPNPEGVFKAMDQLDIMFPKAAYVGDSDVDIYASRSAGVFSILASWTPTAKKELIGLGPDKFFENVPSFISWLKDLR